MQILFPTTPVPRFLQEQGTKQEPKRKTLEQEKGQESFQTLFEQELAKLEDAPELGED